MSNQIVGVRRASVTDLSFAHEAGGTFGLEHDYYKEHHLVTGAWVGTHETWRIIEALTDERRTEEGAGQLPAAPGCGQKEKEERLMETKIAISEETTAALREIDARLASSALTKSLPI
jgi:hypothetical protein